MKQRIPKEGMLRPDLDNAIVVTDVAYGMNRDKYLEKFNNPVYNNREKAIMNLMETETMIKNSKPSAYIQNKKPKTVRTAAEFNSLLKRKEKNLLKSKDLLVDVAKEKAQHVAELMRKNALESIQKRKTEFQDYDELEESDYDKNLTDIQQNTEEERKRQHDIHQTHNFQMDTRSADDYIKNIFDVAGNMGVPSTTVEKNIPINPKWKLDTQGPSAKPKRKKVVEPVSNNFVVDSAIQFKSRLTKIKNKNENILKKDHAELFTKKVPNRKLKKFVEQRGGGRGGLMGVYDAYSELKKQGFKGKFIDDEQTKFDQRKPRHLRKMQEKQKVKRSWKQIAHKAQQLSKVKQELPKEVAKKWVDGLLRYNNVEDLLKEADDRLEQNEKQLKRRLKKGKGGQGLDGEIWQDLQELKRIQDEEENQKIVDAEAELSFVEDVDSEYERDEEESAGELDHGLKLRNASDDEDKDEDESEKIEEIGEIEELEEENNEGQEDDNGFQDSQIQGEDLDPEEPKNINEEEPENEPEEDNNNVTENISEIEKENENTKPESPPTKPQQQTVESNENIDESHPPESIQPKYLNTATKNDTTKCKNDEPTLTPTQKTSQMIKQMKKAQQEVNQSYQNQIAQVESQLAQVKQKLDSLQQPLAAEKQFYDKQKRSKIEQFMKDKNINATKRRIRYGLDMIESIKTSVTSINVNRAIDLKDSYDRIRDEQRRFEQPVPENSEFQNYYLSDWEKRRQEEKEKEELKKLEEKKKLEKLKDDAKRKENEDKNALRFEKARNKLSDAQRNFVLKNIVADDPDLDARVDIDHPWIDFD